MSLFPDLHIPSIGFRDRLYSASFVQQQIDTVAKYLDEKCRGKSPIVCLVATNHVKTVSAYFGILNSGRVCLLVEPESRALEWSEIMRKTPPCAVVRFDENTDRIDPVREIQVIDRTLDGGALDGGALAELDGVATMLYTAADDGEAKPAMLTHANLIANARAISREISKYDLRCCCALLPFHHMFGLQSGLLAPAISGASLSIVGLSDFLDSRRLVATMRRDGVSCLSSVPVMFERLADVWDSEDAPDPPRVLVSGGCKLNAALHERYRKRFDRVIREGYGLTEAAPICTWQAQGDCMSAESVGSAIDCCQIRIETETGEATQPGTAGEVCIRGSNVMKGYFGYGEQSRDTLRGGWLHTGDIGHLDEAGHLYLTGLRKRMINVSGKKVFPAEVERFMRLQGNVDEVCVYGGKAPPAQGQSVRGRVRLKEKGPEAEGAFVDWCAKRISAYKIPRRIEFV